MNITKSEFGILPDGTVTYKYTVSNGYMSFSATDFGCTITNIMLPDSQGSQDDVVLGFSNAADYFCSKNLYFGSIIGRYANRISEAQFELDGERYNLDKNDGHNSLHGGFTGFDKIVWKAEKQESADCAGIRFSRVSPDGEQGFPGNVALEVSYMLSTGNELICTYKAFTDKPTPINLTNHSYFNLSGCCSGSIVDTEIQLYCNQMLSCDVYGIPTGEILSVAGTPFDFTKSQSIRLHLDDTGSGYDHCFVTPLYDQCVISGRAFSDNCNDLVKIASVYDPASGRRMEVETNQEGTQFYTANWIKNSIGKNKCRYQNHDAFCLETQSFPDSPNKKYFPSTILRPGQTYCSKTIYRFLL